MTSVLALSICDMVPVRSLGDELIAIVPAGSTQVEVEETAAHAWGLPVPARVLSTQESEGFSVLCKAHSSTVPALIGPIGSFPASDRTHLGYDLDNPSIVEEFCAGLAEAAANLSARFGPDCPEWRLSVPQIGGHGLFAHVLPADAVALLLVSFEDSTLCNGAAAQVDLVTGELQRLDVALLRNGTIGYEFTENLLLTRGGFAMCLIAWFVSGKETSMVAKVESYGVDFGSSGWTLELRCR